MSDILFIIVPLLLIKKGWIRDTFIGLLLCCP